MQQEYTREPLFTKSFWIVEALAFLQFFLHFLTFDPFSGLDFLKYEFVQTIACHFLLQNVDFVDKFLDWKWNIHHQIISNVSEK